ncbi:hypothetical protein Hanom_Chr03g00277831 [Helianthus anomalus]
MIVRPHKVSFSCLYLHHHFNKRLMFIFLRAPNPRPLFSRGHVTFSQYTQAIFYFSLLPPQKNLSFESL